MAAVHPNLRRRYSLPDCAQVAVNAEHPGKSDESVRLGRSSSPRSDWPNQRAVTFHPNLEVSGEDDVRKQYKSCDSLLAGKTSSDFVTPSDGRRKHHAPLTRRATLSTLVSKIGEFCGHGIYHFLMLP